MRDEVIFYLLIHSKADWAKLLGAADVDSFLEWIWDEVDSCRDGSPKMWIASKVNEFAGN